MNPSTRLAIRSRIRVFSDSEASPPNVAETADDGRQLRHSILQARQWLLSEQQIGGYWEGELEGDTILESEYILLLAFLDRHESQIAQKAARHILDKQLADGGWSIYPGGKMDISASVKAYFALKLTGKDPSDPEMQLARTAILRNGGADAVNSFTRFYLALLGQISYEQCPNVPPEFLFAPRWFPVNLYSTSAWSRTIFVPLSIISALRPSKQLDPALGIRELFLREPQDWPPLCCPGRKISKNPISWDRFFRTMDRFSHALQRRGIQPFRGLAIRKAKQWMLDRFNGSDGLGAIFPPIVWSVVALRAMGYSDDSAEVSYCHEQLKGLIIEEQDSARLQPCRSPVWDTAFAVTALMESGVANDHPAIVEAVEWLLSKESRREGDWAKTVKAEPSGWYFEHANEFYPDADDTAMVLMALQRQLTAAKADETSLPTDIRITEPEGGETTSAQTSDANRISQAIQRGTNWLLAMQNRDGGWGAFDKDNDAEFLCDVPFADHNAMIDPSSPDLAARVLEALGKLGHRIDHPAVGKCVKYLRQEQQPDGSWFGRWGVNYIYGAWQVLVGLTAVGVPSDDPAVIAAANWLLAHQQADGGWGETPASYEQPHLRGQGNTTASQTAWAILGLMAAGKSDHPAVARGVQFLLDTQNVDGVWDEYEFTGTGFPQVFYLKYHLYPVYFPLLALSGWAKSGPRQRHPMTPRPTESAPRLHDHSLLVGA